MSKSKKQKSSDGAPSDSGRHFDNGEYNVPVRLGRVSVDKISCSVGMSVPRTSFRSLRDEETFIAAEHSAVFTTDDELFGKGFKLPLNFTTANLSKGTKRLSFTASFNRKANDMEIVELCNCEGFLKGKAVAVVEKKPGRPKKCETTPVEDVPGQGSLMDDKA